MEGTEQLQSNERTTPPALQLSDVLQGEELTPGTYFDAVDHWRTKGPLVLGDAQGNPFWLITEMAAMREACQRTENFSSSAIQMDYPNPDYQLIPLMLDPPDHAVWRRLLGPLFSPGVVAEMRSKIRARFDEILDEVAPRGQCDFVTDVAYRFPNTIFLDMMGMPVSDAERFQQWEEAILHHGSQGSETAMAASAQVMQYFSELIEDRYANPKDDIVSKATTWTIDGEPVSREDLLSFCLLMFQAGLDTVASQLAYSFYHLATNPADRERIVVDPSLIPTANEELLRYYSIVATGRKVTRDTELAGCPVKAGEMVLVAISGANRDPKEFARADEVVIDREQNRHMAFGLGPHRCLGSHLARLELRVAMEAWHQRIPVYRLDESRPTTEHAAGLIGLNTLPLKWDI
jgi:cytochrome P450